MTVENKKPKDLSSVKDRLQEVLSNIEIVEKERCLYLYETGSKDDDFYIDTQIEHEQYIKSLIFRRTFFDRKLDENKITQNGLVEEIGSVKDITNPALQIPKQSNDQVMDIVELYSLRYAIYNSRIKVAKEIYQELYKKTFVERNSANYNPNNFRKASAKFNLKKAQEIVSHIDQVRSQPA